MVQTFYKGEGVQAGEPRPLCLREAQNFIAEKRRSARGNNLATVSGYLQAQILARGRVGIRKMKGLTA